MSVVSRPPAGGGPTRRATFRRCEPGEPVLPTKARWIYLSRWERSLLGACGHRVSVWPLARVDSRRGSMLVSDRGVGLKTGWGKSRVACNGRCLGGLPSPKGRKQPLSCRDPTGCCSQERRHPACGACTAQSGGVRRFLVVLTNPHNCRSRWAARGSTGSGE